MASDIGIEEVGESCFKLSGVMSHFLFALKVSIQKVVRK